MTDSEIIKSFEDKIAGKEYKEPNDVELLNFLRRIKREKGLRKAREEKIADLETKLQKQMRITEDLERMLRRHKQDIIEEYLNEKENLWNNWPLYNLR